MPNPFHFTASHQLLLGLLLLLRQRLLLGLLLK
jgi:hypothetical protein